MNKEETISSVSKKLLQINHEELEHINHYLDALTKAKDGNMHYHGKYLRITEEKDGSKMELGLQNENIYGVAQGGAVYTLADVSIGFYILRQIPEGKVFTQELKVNFIKKGEGKYLYAKPSILHLGNRTVVSDCSIRDEHNQLVAQALGTFYITN